MALIEDAKRAIYCLTRLPIGWDYGQGGAVRDSTCARAVTILNELGRLGLSEFDIAPGRDGAITIAATKHEYEVEIQCRETGKYDVYATRAESDPLDDDDLVFSELVAKLGSLPWLSKKSSTSSIPSVIYVVWEDSPANVLKTRLMVPVRQSFASNASVDREGIFANISSNMSELRYAANRQSFGVFESPNYQEA